MQFTIKQARQYAGITQAQMAESLGVCRHRYMKIEKDASTATVATAKGCSGYRCSHAGFGFSL